MQGRWNILKYIFAFYGNKIIYCIKFPRDRSVQIYIYFGIRSFRICGSLHSAKRKVLRAVFMSLCVQD